jgi:tetraacyldisaccharide 4'-kinase
MKGPPVFSPAFWRQNGLAPHLLAPLGAATALLTAKRVARPGLRLNIPVICIGNAGVGGAGKTMVARDILLRLQVRRKTPFALTRGYGGRLAGPVRADLLRHDADDLGDEALLLARTAPVIVAKNRAAGGQFAAVLGADAIVMDDGLQNPGLVKTLSLLVIDGGAGFGNGRCLPAGPLRETVTAAASRCQAAVLIGEDRCDARAQLPYGLPVLAARLVPSCEIPLRGRRVIGFAGIGRPEKFFESLRGLGAELARTLPFPDHHRYTAADFRRLDALAEQERAILVTTEKDAVKLPEDFHARCAIITARLEFGDAPALEALLP